MTCRCKGSHWCSNTNGWQPVAVIKSNPQSRQSFSYHEQKSPIFGSSFPFSNTILILVELHKLQQNCSWLTLSQHEQDQIPAEFPLAEKGKAKWYFFNCLVIRWQERVKQILNMTFTGLSLEIKSIRSSGLGKTRVRRLCVHHWMLPDSFACCQRFLALILLARLHTISGSDISPNPE